MNLSFPVRERGLKQIYVERNVSRQIVVPRAGTWIETQTGSKKKEILWVVPRAGTWIETDIRSLFVASSEVVPRAGTWIETERSPCFLITIGGRSPCGNVD